jgi:RNA-directed DNA polymerase
MAVKIAIEPIFEADFEESSYGFRPKRGAHQAMNDLSLIRPSKKAMTKVKGAIKAWTGRRTLELPTEVVIEKLNEVVRGWVGYFYYGNCSHDLAWIKWFLEERVRIFLKQKHGLRSRRNRAYPYRHLYETLPLYKIPTTAPWTAKAAG